MPMCREIFLCFNSLMNRERNSLLLTFFVRFMVLSRAFFGKHRANDNIVTMRVNVSMGTLAVSYMLGATMCVYVYES